MPKRLGVVVAADAAAVALAREAVKKPGVVGLVVVVGVLNNLLEGAVPPVKPLDGVEALAEKLLKMPVMVAVVVCAPNTILVVGVPPIALQEVVGVPPNILAEEAGVAPKMLPEELAVPPNILPEVDGVPPNIPGPENIAGLLAPKRLGVEDAAVVGVFAPPNMLGESVVSFPKVAGVVDGADVAPN